jgi:superoxide dismutase, Fe-Mn family
VRARAGTNLENMSVAQIVISTAPHESQTLAFNYASLALNNSFFLHYIVSLGPLPVLFHH